MTPDFAVRGTRSAEVCVVGNVLTDLIVRGVPTMPEWGQEIAGTGHAFVTSGQAGYLAQGLAAQGLPVSVVALVGDDDEGARIRGDLRAAGVDATTIGVVEGDATAITVALVRADGERAFVSDFACLRHLDEAAVMQHWDRVERAGWMCLVGLFNLPGLSLDMAARLLARAREAGAVTVLDTGWDPGNWPTETVAGTLRLLEHVDVFLPNDEEARVLTDHADPAAALDVLADLTHGLVVIKCGADGAVARRGEERWAAPAVPATVHDTVGAGDVFNAGLITALQRGDDVGDALAWANATASQYVSSATDRFPSPAAVRTAAGV